MTTLRDLPPAAAQGWRTLFELDEDEAESCLLIGGQMMYLLAAENGARLPRVTEDVDVVVDVRTRPRGTEWLATWLEDRGFELEGMNTDGIGHRFVRAAEPGPGRVIFDVLAPEGLGERTRVMTTPPARTVQAPGTQQAFSRSGRVAVTVTGATGEWKGWVRRPDLLGGLVLKAAATSIAVRSNPERDWQDAALLLSLLPDPLASAAMCDRKDRQRLRRLAPLLDGAHQAWALLGSDAHRRGSTALEFLLA